MVSNRLVPLALASLLVSAPALAQDVQYRLVNNSPLTLMEFYSSPVTDPGWGDDILGNLVLSPGDSGTVTIADGQSYCSYDFQFVMEDGSVIEGQADICTTEQFILQ
ncbi:MAG: hypothetical protein IT542_00700 [Rubellimicrobium sp.]|nr:hypothetical protein [Rubellimicrobium sp.]